MVFCFKMIFSLSCCFFLYFFYKILLLLEINTCECYMYNFETRALVIRRTFVSSTRRGDWNGTIMHIRCGQTRITTYWDRIGLSIEIVYVLYPYIEQHIRIYLYSIVEYACYLNTQTSIWSVYCIALRVSDTW